MIGVLSQNNISADSGHNAELKSGDTTVKVKSERLSPDYNNDNMPYSDTTQIPLPVLGSDAIELNGKRLFPLKYPCQMCGIRFSNPETLRAHTNQYCNHQTVRCSSQTKNRDKSPSRTTGLTDVKIIEIVQQTNRLKQQMCFRTGNILYVAFKLDESDTGSDHSSDDKPLDLSVHQRPVSLQCPESFTDSSMPLDLSCTGSRMNQSRRVCVTCGYTSKSMTRLRMHNRCHTSVDDSDGIVMEYNRIGCTSDGKRLKIQEGEINCDCSATNQFNGGKPQEKVIGNAFAVTAGKSNDECLGSSYGLQKSDCMYQRPSIAMPKIIAPQSTVVHPSQVVRLTTPLRMDCTRLEPSQMTSHNIIPGSFLCGFCGVKFSSMTNLNQHILYYCLAEIPTSMRTKLSSDESKATSSRWPKRFVSAQSIAREEDEAGAPEGARCEECNINFRLKSSLNAHKRHYCGATSEASR